MKKISILLVCILMLVLGGCGKAQKKVTAQSIINELKTKEASHMKNITVITTKNDTNNLLGRPNQYTEKITWNDNRAAADTSNDCTIEVFNNKKDASSRKTYIDSVTKAMPMLVQYITLKDNAVLRIEGALTPTQAKEYANIINNN